MTIAAGTESLPPPLNGADGPGDSAHKPPPAPAVTPPEPARDDLFIAAVGVATITALIAALIAWRQLRSWRRRRC